MTTEYTNNDPYVTVKVTYTPINTGGIVKFDHHKNQLYVIDDYGYTTFIPHPVVEVKLSPLIHQMLQWYMERQSEEEKIKDTPFIKEMYEQFQVMKALCIK